MFCGLKILRHGVTRVHFQTSESEHLLFVNVIKPAQNALLADGMRGGGWGVGELDKRIIKIKINKWLLITMECLRNCKHSL